MPRIIKYSSIPSLLVCNRSKIEKKNVANTITKTSLYNFDPLKPHFYIVKLGFTGVYIILLISAQKHRLWVLVRTASMFWAKIWKISRILYLKNFQFLVVNFSIYLNRRVFVMQRNSHLSATAPSLWQPLCGLPKMLVYFVFNCSTTDTSRKHAYINLTPPTLKPQFYI